MDFHTATSTSLYFTEMWQNACRSVNDGTVFVKFNVPHGTDNVSPVSNKRQHSWLVAFREHWRPQVDGGACTGFGRIGLLWCRL